jgi:cytochrome c
MSVQEIQSQLTKLTPQEQADIARFLETIRQTHSPEFARDLAQGHREMDAGRKISEAELAQLLEAHHPTPRP